NSELIMVKLLTTISGGKPNWVRLASFAGSFCRLRECARQAQQGYHTFTQTKTRVLAVAKSHLFPGVPAPPTFARGRSNHVAAAGLRHSRAPGQSRPSATLPDQITQTSQLGVASPIPIPHSALRTTQSLALPRLPGTVH
ncbi:MAG TPA: hypothetical protein VL527_14870, partial [Dongiaceae bacterium]|nr:hypothetical protein [Dongiaceae bacterium]